MKKINKLLTILIALMAVVGIACTQQNKKIMFQSDSKIKAVFIGNSITQQWNEHNSNFFKSNEYVPKGISGQTTPQFLARFRKDVIKLRPQIVVINGGINDIAGNTGEYSQEATFENIQSMTELAKANGIKVILTSVLPAAGIPWNEAIQEVPAKIIALNKQILQYAQENDITYVDYYTHMVDPALAMKAEYTTDNLHVSPAGYEVMQTIIKAAIDKELAK